MNGIKSINPLMLNNFPSSSSEEIFSTVPKKANQGISNKILEPGLGGLGAAGILYALDKFKKKRGIGDNNPPSPIDEKQPPRKEPPKGPDIVEDLLTEAATKEIEKNIKNKQPVKEETQKEISEEVKPKSYTTQNYLDDKLMDKLLVMRGGIKGFEEKMSGPMAPMPSSTKYKMEIELQKKLFDKYGFGNYPEGETPDTVTPERKEELLNRYDRRIGAINYISSVAYDVIGEPDPNALLVVDEDGLPIAAAKIDIPGKGALSGSDISSRDAVVITEMGSVFREANDQLFNDIIQKAKDENRRFIVAEDLTSEKAYQAVKNRGFKDPTTKDTKKFKGQKIRRPSGKIAYQKNLVLDLDPPKKTIKPSNVYKSLDAGGSKDI